MYLEIYFKIINNQTTRDNLKWFTQCGLCLLSILDVLLMNQKFLKAAMNL